MRTKLPLLATVFLNLAVWNYFISGSWGSLFSLEYFIVIHIIISSVTVLLLLLLARKFLLPKKTSLLLLLSILVAYLPPAITIWLTYAVPQLLALQFEGLLYLIIVAVITTAISWYFWLPLGVANFFLLQKHSRTVTSLGQTANNTLNKTGANNAPPG